MKKILAILLTMTMVLSLLTVPAAASDGMTTGTIRGYQFYYSDSYFSKNASVYDPSLSTMSFLMTYAGSATSADNWTHQYDKLFRAFKDIGFTDAEVNADFETEPTMDSMGVGAAHKTITVNGKKYTVLIAVPRMNYTAEWASNFTLGTSGEASGFSSSAAIVETFLSDYVNRYKTSFEGELKLWLVGYSRGGAVTNLVAGHITASGQLAGLPVTAENIYAYTFETPKPTNTSVISQAEAKSYTNIHNVITANDLITKVAPEEWGFLRYGTDESVIPDTRTEATNALFETALTFLPETFAGYTADGKRVFASELFQAKKFSLTGENFIENSDKTMSEFVDDIFKAAASVIGSRLGYTILLQDTARLIGSEIEGDGYQSEAWKRAGALLKAELQARTEELINLADSDEKTELKELLTDAISSAFAEAGLDTDAYRALPGQLINLVPLFVSVIIADVAIDGGADIITLIDNLDNLNIFRYPHKNGQVAAWLMALDPHYNPEAESQTNNVTVSDVLVNIKKVTTTKKVLFTKVTRTHYETEIIPVTNGGFKKVEYRKIQIGKLTEGASFTQDREPTYLYINVTDANGNVTHWEYKNGSVKQVNK